MSLFRLDDRLQVNQIFIEADFENAADEITRLIDRILIDSARPKPAQPRVACVFRNQFIRDLTTVMTGKILIDFIGWPGIASLN